MDSSKSTKRYLVLTAFATPLNLVVFAVLVRLTSWPPVLCNLASATLLTVPTFLVCQLWVWPDTDATIRRIVLFWASTLVNVAVSSVVVWACSKTGLPRGVTVFLPTLTYTVLWWLRLRFLSAVVFKQRQGRRPAGSELSHS